MHKIRFNARRTKNLIVSMTLAVIVAAPMLSQPLGLFFAFKYPQAATKIEQPEALITEETVSVALEPFTAFDGGDVALNRSLTDAEVLALMSDVDIDGNEEDASVDDAMMIDPIDDPMDVFDPAIESTDPIIEPADPIVEIAAHTLYVNASQVNLRAEPNKESAILTKLSIGDKLVCTGEMEGWVKVKDSEGREGFLSSIFVSKTMIFKVVAEIVYVKANQVNFREEPTTSSDILSKLVTDQKLTRTGIGDGWSRVKTAAGKTGYIASDFLTMTVPASVKAAAVKAATAGTPVVNKSGNKIVDLAHSMLGVRYVFSGESRSGVDCSGLIYYIYRQIGVTVPRSSSGYYNFGSAVSLSQIQPGDVIAMDTRRSDGKTSITHVGIYVGGGNMVHASSTNHRVVLANVNHYLTFGIKLITIRRIRA